MMDEPAAPAASAATGLARVRRWGWRVVRVPMVGLTVLAGVLAALLLLATLPVGTRMLLGAVPGLQVVQPQGSLWRSFRAQRVEFALAGLPHVVFDDLAWLGFEFERVPTASSGWGVALKTLSARRVVIDLPAQAPRSAPLAPPVSLALPLGVRVGQLRIDALQLSALGAEPVRDLRASVALQHSDNAGAVGRALGAHRLEGLALRWQQWSIEGAARVVAARPFTLQADVAVSAAAGGAARLSVSGTLTQLAVQARVDAHGQHVQATAEIHPFAPWPVSRLQASAQALDLAALDARAPRTRLSGQVQVLPERRAEVSPSPTSKPTPSGATPTARLPQETMLVISGAWRNEGAGRWDQGRLPVRALQFQARLAASDGRVGALQRVHIELGTEAAAAGRVQAQGQWQVRQSTMQPMPLASGATAPGWQLLLALDQLQPALLDAGAPAMRVSGPLQLRGQTLSWAPLQVSANLAGQLDATQARPREGHEVRVKLAADLAPREVRVQTLQAQAGAAMLSAQGQAVDAGGGTWRLRAGGQWSRFDPAVWWPALAAGDGASDLQGRLDADLTWHTRAAASGATGDALADMLSRVQGQANAAIERSTLLGVPLSARLNLSSAAGSSLTSLDAMLHLADNQLTVQGQVDAAVSARDRWSLALDARELAALAPLARRFGLDTLRGRMQAQAQAHGRWPHLSTQGQWQASAIDLTMRPLSANSSTSTPHRLALQQGSAQWQWGAVATEATAPMQTTLALQGAVLDAWQIERLQARTQGNAAHHQASLGINALLPPALAQALQGTLQRRDAQAPLRLSAHLALDGQFGGQPAAQKNTPWRARWQQFELGPDTQSMAGSPLGTQPWLRIEPFDLSWDQAEARTHWRASATRLSLLGAQLALAPTQLSHGDARPASIELNARLEPIRLASVLALLQPHTGWGGDLLVGGFVRCRRGDGASPPLELDAEIARQSGDLTLTDAAVEGGAVQPLRLQALRLGVSAHQGVWRLQQQLAGGRIGTLQADLGTHTDAQAWWPGAQDPLDGRIDANVSNLRLWGLWVPAGWRLSGQMQGHLDLKGVWGQPIVSGGITGQQLGVRNLLEGVDFERGELDLALDGTQARLNRLILHAGPGELMLTGQARLDAQPEALLQLSLQRFAVLQRIDRRLLLSGHTELGLQADSLWARGAINVDEGLFDISRAGAPTLDDDVRRAGIDDQLSDDAPAATASRWRKALLDIAIDLGSQLRLRGYGLDTALTGQLKLSHHPTRYKPQLHGTVRTHNGTFAAYGQKLVIDRGLIRFNGVIDNPGLDIEATRPPTRMASSASLTATTADSDVRVGVAITGTAQNPRIRLFSEPEMSETDKLSWLILGHASGGLAGADIALLQGAASALMGGDTSSLGQGLFQSIGLDEMSVRQNDGSSGDTVVTVGKQLSRRWYLGYERSLNATAGTWQLIYRLAQRFTVRAQTGLDNSLDLIWVWRWD